MKNYKILLLGRQTYKKDWDLLNSRECWEFMSISLLEEFKKLPNVKIDIAHIHHPKRDGYKYEDLPEADCIVFCGLPVTFDQIDLAKLKQITKYKKLVTFLERGLTNSGVDWAFEFKGEAATNTTFIPAPINKKLYKNIPKEPKTILLDHAYEESLSSCVHTLEHWLESVKDEYKVYRLIRADEKNPLIKDFVTPIKETNFFDYINAISKMENFVVTHMESFGFSNIDISALGTRVLTPPNFLCRKGLQDYFGFQTFSNKEEFIACLREPINKEILDKRIDKMTDYSDIVKIIDKKLREMLLKDRIVEIENELKEVKIELESVK